MNNLGINKPVKSFWAILAVLFFALFGINDTSALDFELNTENDFFVSFDYASPDRPCGGLLIEFIGPTGYPDLIFTDDLESVDIEYYGLDVTGSMVEWYYDNEDIHNYRFTFENDNLLSLYVDNILVASSSYAYDNINLLDSLRLNLLSGVISNLDYTQINNDATTGCYISNNDDIGVITGTTEYWNGTGTTTEYTTYKAPFLLMVFIGFIMTMIIIIIIGWVFYR